MNRANTIENKVIRKEMLLLQKECSTKNDAINSLIEKAFDTGLINKKEIFMEVVLEREAEIPTAIGYGIAIPHGKSKEVKEPFIGFLQVRNSFQWTEEIDDEVKLVFLIGVSDKNENNLHLKFISQLSKKLLDEDFRQSLKEVREVEKAFELLTTINNTIQN